MTNQAVAYPFVVYPHGKSQFDHPYNYDPFLIFHSLENIKGERSTAYSDRLFQQNDKKFNELCEKHFGNSGQYFDNRKPKDVEAFLQDYFDYPELKLILIEQQCNVATGFPLWRFEFVRSNG